MGVVRMFLVCRKGVSRMLQTCWNKCFNWLFKESFDGVSRLFQSLTQEVSRLSQENVVGVSRKFVRCLWCFREASLVPIVFQGYIKGEVGCYKTLSLHGNHRSYPSWRRVCFFCNILYFQISLRWLLFLLTFSTLFFVSFVSLLSSLVSMRKNLPHTSDRRMVRMMMSKQLILWIIIKNWD